MAIISKTTISILLLMVALCFAGCNFNKNETTAATKIAVTKSPAPPIARSSPAHEDFERFFLRFKSNPIFQKSRVVFPLKIIIPGTAKEAGSLRLIPKQDWRFLKIFNTYTGKQMIRKASVNPTKFKVEYLVEDTGMETDFQFENKNGQWKLVLVRDLSD